MASVLDIHGVIVVQDCFIDDFSDFLQRSKVFIISSCIVFVFYSDWEISTVNGKSLCIEVALKKFDIHGGRGH